MGGIVGDVFGKNDEPDYSGLQSVQNQAMGAYNASVAKQSELYDKLMGFYTEDRARGQQLWGPVQDKMSAYYSGYDPANAASSPSYQAAKSQAERLYGQARDKIISTTPTGGGLYRNLARTDMAKADTLTDALAGINQQELSNALNLATGGATSANAAANSLTGVLSSLTQTNPYGLQLAMNAQQSILGNQQAYAAQQDAQMTNLGTSLGKLAMSK